MNKILSLFCALLMVFSVLTGGNATVVNAEETSDATNELNNTVIIGEIENNGVVVKVEALAGTFVEGTTVSLDTYSEQEAVAYVQSVSSDIKATGFNITFNDINGNKVQPQNGKMVKVTFVINDDSDMYGNVNDFKIYHIGENGAELLETADVTETDNAIEISVNATEFSPYVLTSTSGVASSPVLGAPASSSSGSFDISLLYSDKTEAGSKTHQNINIWDDFFGILKIEPNNLTEDMSDVVVRVSIPKEYVEENSLAFNMGENSSSEFEAYTVVDDGSNYVITLNFTNYDKTESFGIPFTLRMKRYVVPTDYELNVTASITYGGKTETTDTPLTYKPVYQTPGVSKRLNDTNNPQVQNTAVYLETEIINGKQVVTSDATVTYAFAYTGTPAYWRAADKVRFVDELPTYTDVYGNVQTATFDPAKNPGWTLSSDGKSVYYEVEVTEPTGSQTWENVVNTALSTLRTNAVLKLGFPGMVVENDTSLNAIANTAHFEYDVHEPSAGEDATTSSANNTLTIRLTADGKPVGNFNKTVNVSTMTDNNESKATSRMWTLTLRNTGTVPYTNLVFHDVHTATVAGLDSRMKFTRINVNIQAANGVTLSDVDYVKVYYDDGSSENLTFTAVSHVWSTAIIDDDKVATGFEVYFKSDFELRSGGLIQIQAYSTLIDPDNTAFDEDDATNNNFTNEASVSYGTGVGADEITDSSKFVLNPVDEYLRVTKSTQDNGTSNQRVGSKIRFLVNVQGSLLSKVNKDYGTIQVIDLLPDDIEYDSMWSTNDNNRQLFDTDYEPIIVENYQNTGRTAVIFEIEQDKLLSRWANNSGNAYFYFYATIKDDARTGTVVNDIYVSADGLDDLKDKTQVAATQKTQDVNDLDRDGNTEEYIAHGASNVSINISATMYGEKQIANIGQDNWNKTSVTGGPGDEFQYKLIINNELTTTYTGLVMYDVLPNIGDTYLSDSSSRDSNMRVTLTGAVSAPAGYTVYYTTSDSVYTADMNTAVNDTGIWSASVSDWSEVTAIKVVADSGTVLTGSEKIEVVVNAKLPTSLSSSQLNNTEHIGVNTFGFYTDQSTGVKESNDVKINLTLGTLHMKKTNVDGDALKSVTFQLLDSNNTVLQTKTTDDNGLIEFNNLVEGTYILREAAALTGYKKVDDIAVIVSQNAINKEWSATATLGSESLSGRGTDNDPLVVVNEIETITIEGTKTWDDANNQDGKRPSSITVRLFNGSTEVASKTVTADVNGDWKYSFEAPKYDNGQLVTYTIQEDAVTGYTTTITGYNIKNSYTPEKITVSGEKTWSDNSNQDGVRPTSITIRLLADGTEVANKTVTAGDNWKYSFTNLPKYSGGTEVTYTITEDAVSGYTTQVTGYDVENTHTPGKTSVTVTKAWDDNNNQDGIRPNSVTVKLYANNVDTGKTVVLTAANNWTAIFANLDEKQSGQTVNYSVKEESVTGYTSNVTGTQSTGYIVTNKHTPATVEVKGEKTWDDANNQDGVRPTSITIRLLADGIEVANKTVTAGDNWKYSFTNLPKYNNGNEIAYTITEDAVSGYTTQVTGYDVENTHNPGKTSVTVTKAWDDNSNQDGKRAESVTIHLYADDVDTGKTVTLSEDNNWTAIFTNLDEKNAGQTIVYTVTEDDVDDYTVEITGNATIGFTVTNTHTPETIKVEGTKTWDDKDDQDGKRPTSITVNLLENGNVIDSKVVTEDNNWTYSFDNLPKYENGTEIVYTVTEDAVADYTTTYDGYNITNSYTPGKTSVTVTKAWNDSNNKDGIRPSSIQVQLYANGEKAGDVVTLTADMNWTYTWTDLDAMSNKKDITYSVEEVSEVEGYTKDEGEVVNGNVTITNSHTPKATNVPNTGDSTNLTFWFGTMFTSLIALFGMLIWKKKYVKN